MENHVVISVIVPVYNVEKYLSQCIESILNQTFNNLELILIDDGSTDNSGEICDEYAIKDNRIRVIHKENGGISSARNTGLNATKGDYIAFVDSDDYIAMDMFEKMLDIAIKTNADMVKCGFNEFNINSVKRTVNFGKQEILENDVNGCSLLHLYFQNVLYIVAWNAIYKRDLAVKVRFPERLINEDNYSAGLYLYYAKKIVCMNEALYYYRDVSNGLSKVGKTKKPLDIVVVKAMLYEHLLNNGVKNNDFFTKLEKQIARVIYNLIKQNGRNGVKICCMDKTFYDFVITRLSWRRRLRLGYWNLIKRFDLK